jgi:predicted lipoprotein with Yx(FWY)xxD motif
MYNKKTLMASVCVAVLAGCAGSAPLKSDNGVLTDQTGRTVYTFDKDTANNGKSVCNGPCAALWPAVPAGAMAPATPYSTITRDDGSQQLAYKGKPVYFYSADQKPGDRSGDNFKGIWHTVQQ